MNQSVHKGCLTMYDGSDTESLYTQFKMFQFSTDNRKTATKLVECFCQVPDLVECSTLLVKSGHLKLVLSVGAKWFIEPSLVNPILRILQKKGVQMTGRLNRNWLNNNTRARDLRLGHIICSATYELQLWEVLTQFHDLEIVVSEPTNVRHDGDDNQRWSCCNKKPVSIRELLEQCGLPSPLQSHDDHLDDNDDDIFVPDELFDVDNKCRQ